MDILLVAMSWLAPPIIGAFIGYWTNRIAIRMLFRPLQVKRFASIPIPLTPGVIPKNRYDLASSVGNLVAEELLSPETVRSRLESSKFKDDLRDWVRQQMPSLLRGNRRDQVTDRWLTDRLLGFLAVKAPEICDVVDVRQLATDQINNFEVEQVERMMLGVAGQHLRWISWFGAVLGAIIGCLQLGLRMFY